jgi:hypothetical protein
MSGEVTVESEDKVTIESETMIDIDSTLTVVGGDLEVAGSLQIGPPNYKLVFLNDVSLVTEHVPYAGVY